MGYAVAEQIKTIIIDISEIVVKGDEFIEHLNRLVAALNLMGVSVMLSGVPIHLAANEAISQALSTLDLQYVKSIEDALGLLGYELTEQ